MKIKTISHRRYEFDWLRVAATLMVFLFHSSRFFNQRDWMVKNVVIYPWVDIWCAFAMSWLMPLFFVISGVGLFYSVNQSGGFRKFYTDKFLRLMIPVMVAAVTHSTIQVYLERVSHGLFSGSLLAFIPHYFDGVYQGIGNQGGNYAYMGMHLWYLLFLFVDSLIFYRLFIWLKGPGNILLQRITSLLAVPGLTYIWFCLPLLLMYTTLPPAVLTVGAGDWGFFYYLWFLVAGFLLASSQRLQRSIRTQRWVSLTLAIIFSFLYLYRSSDPSHLLLRSAGISWHYVLLYFLSAWCWIFAILGLAIDRLTFGHPFLRHANEGVLPFYILHQPVLVGIGYVIMGWKIHAALKWMLVSSLSFCVILSLYIFLIRKLELLRFLFGLKTTHPHYKFLRKKGALIAMPALYIGSIFFAASGISIDRTPMSLAYDSDRDIILNSRSITKQSSNGVRVINDTEASGGKVIEFSSGANERIETQPKVYIEMQFYAPAGRYTVWLRGKSDLTEWTDSVWLQVDDYIGTGKGNLCMGNWLSIHPPGLYAWAGNADHPVTIELAYNGNHRIRLQPRQTPHRIDQIWLSRYQLRIPSTLHPING